MPRDILLVNCCYGWDKSTGGAAREGTMGTRNKLTEYACVGRLKSKIGSKLSHVNSKKIAQARTEVQQTAGTTTNWLAVNPSWLKYNNRAKGSRRLTHHSPWATWGKQYELQLANFRITYAGAHSSLFMCGWSQLWSQTVLCAVQDIEPKLSDKRANFTTYVCHKVYCRFGTVLSAVETTTIYIMRILHQPNIYWPTTQHIHPYKNNSNIVYIYIYGPSLDSEELRRDWT